MANEHDGSIIIDTELDYEGFEQGTKKLLDAVKAFEQRISKIGEGIQSSLGAALPILSEIAASTAEINEKMSGTATQAAAANDRFVDSEQRVKQAAAEAAAAIGQQARATSAASAAQTGAAKAASGATQYDAALAKVQTQIDKAKDKLASYYQELAEIQASTDEMLAQSATDEQAANVMAIEEQQIQRLNEKYASQLATLQKLEEEYARLSSLRASAGSGASPVGDVESVKALETELSKIIEKINQYEAKIEKMKSLGATDRQWATVRYDLEQAKNELSEFQAKLSSLHQSGAVPTADYERLSVAIGNAAGQQQNLTNSIRPTVWGQFGAALKNAADAALRLAKKYCEGIIQSRRKRHQFSCRQAERVYSSKRPYRYCC